MILNATERTNETLDKLFSVTKNEEIKIEKTEVLASSLQADSKNLDELEQFGETIEYIGSLLRKIVKSEQTKRAASRRLEQKQRSAKITEKHNNLRNKRREAICYTVKRINEDRMELDENNLQ